MTVKTVLLVVGVLAASGAVARPPNYDEAKVAPYTLEDPLTFADGRKLRTPPNGRPAAPRSCGSSSARCSAARRRRRRPS